MENEQRQSQQTLLSCEDSKGIEANFEMVFNIIGEVAEKVDPIENQVSADTNGVLLRNIESDNVAEFLNNYGGFNIIEKIGFPIQKIYYDKDTFNVFSIYDESNHANFDLTSTQCLFSFDDGDSSDFNVFTINKSNHQNRNNADISVFSYVKRATFEFTFENNNVVVSSTFLSLNGDVGNGVSCIPLGLDFHIDNSPLLTISENRKRIITGVTLINNERINIKSIEYVNGVIDDIYEDEILFTNITTELVAVNSYGLV